MIARLGDDHGLLFVFGVACIVFGGFPLVGSLQFFYTLCANNGMLLLGPDRLLFGDRKKVEE